MSTNYVIRNYRSADFDALLQLKNMAAALAADSGYLSSQAMHNLLGRPGYKPERDLFVAEIANDVVGYLDINAEARIGRAVLEVLVFPEYRRQGIARELYRQATPRVKSTGVRVVHVNVCEDNTTSCLVLEKTGFSRVRRFYELTVDLVAVPAPSPPAEFSIRPFREGEEATLTELQNRAYAGSWGYNPNTVEDIVYATSITNNARGGICLALDKDIPVGYFWVRTEYIEQDKRRGRLAMLGVDPDYRGEGIGRALLLAGLSCLKDGGLQVARLTVDSENVAANVLYRSIGFKESDTSMWYEKVLE